MIDILAKSVTKTIVVAMLTAAATTFGTKAVEYGFDRLKEADKKPKKKKVTKKTTKG